MNASSPAAAPWSQIVASTAASAVPHSSPSPPPPSSAAVDTFAVTEAAEDIDNTSGGKRPVWSKPSNAAASSVMDADSWPALSESAKAPAKSPPPPPSPPQELVKPSLDLSTLPQSQGTGSMLHSPQKQVKDTAGVNNVTSVPTHQKTYRRSNSNASSNGGRQPPQMSAPQGFVAVPPGSHNHNSAQMEHLPRAGFVPNDQPQRRNSSRNRNGGGLQPRGDGSHHFNSGSRRDQDRGNQDWNAHNRNFNGRDNYRSPRFVPQFVRPPPPTNHAQYYPPPPPPIPPYMGSYGYHDLTLQMMYGPPLHVEPPRSVPFVQPISSAIFFPPPDSELHTKIVNQIDYYFSDLNLSNDTYLKRNMDDQGWVPLNLIAGFNKVKLLTDNIQIVLDAVRTSSVVEVQGDKIRRRNWITLSSQFHNVNGSQVVAQLAKNIQNIDLETNKNGASGELHVSNS